MATSTKAEFEQYRNIRDREQFAEHLAAANEKRVAEDAAADLERRQREFVEKVQTDPPSRQEVIALGDALLEDVVGALRRHVAGRDAYNARLDAVAGEARSLRLVGDRDAPVTWIGEGADRGLHLAGRRIDRAVGWRHGAETVLAAAINSVVRSTR